MFNFLLFWNLQPYYYKITRGDTLNSLLGTIFVDILISNYISSQVKTLFQMEKKSCVVAIRPIWHQTDTVSLPKLFAPISVDGSAG